MAVIKLNVLICGRAAGVLTQDERGLMSFAYLDEYDGTPLSLSMPVANRTYGQAVVRPYLFGLLPDDERQRRAIAEEYDVRPNNPVALLSHIGLDCPGGVQFCVDQQLEDALARLGHYRQLSEVQIAQKLRAIRDDEDATWMGGEESWSLGGNQGKFALALHDGVWCECLGSAPTTHIFKNGVRGYRLQALDEYVCMRAALACGIPVAQVAYQMFEDEPALVIERYDRAVLAGGAIVRIHQEDVCQALSIMPDQKYTADGGPATADVLGLLASTRRAEANLAAFTRMLFFNYLVGATDAHAKNYSLLLGGKDNALLAPLYDVASGLAYEGLRRKGRLAMAIGGENRFGRVGSGAIRRYVRGRSDRQASSLEVLGLTESWCTDVMAELAQAVPRAVAAVFDEAAAQPGADELRGRLEGPIAENCSQTLALL